MKLYAPKIICLFFMLVVWANSISMASAKYSQTRCSIGENVKSPNGEFIAGITSPNDIDDIHGQPVIVTIKDANDKTLTLISTGKDKMVGLEWSSDSRKLAVESAANCVRIVQICPKPIELALIECAYEPATFAWSPDQRYIAVAYIPENLEQKNAMIDIYRTEDGKFIVRQESKGRYVTSLSWGTDSKQLFYGSEQTQKPTKIELSIDAKSGDLSISSQKNLARRSLPHNLNETIMRCVDKLLANKNWSDHDTKKHLLGFKSESTLLSENTGVLISIECEFTLMFPRSEDHELFASHGIYDSRKMAALILSAYWRRISKRSVSVNQKFLPSESHS